MMIDYLDMTYAETSKAGVESLRLLGIKGKLSARWRQMAALDARYCRCTQVGNT